MAIDTRDKRASAINIWLSWRTILPAPASASIIERWMVPGAYAFFAGGVLVTVTGVSATGTVGNVTVTGAATISVTGTSAAAQVGTVAIGFPVTVFLTGVFATGMVGNALVWQVVPIGPPSGDWMLIDPDNPGGWGPIDPDQSGNWTPIDPDNPGGWSVIDPDQPGNWTPIAT